MNAALLNVRVLFQTSTVETDDIGNHTAAWRDYYSCHATVSGEAHKDTSEKEEAGLTVDKAEISFTVRYCRETAAVTSTRYRVLFNGEIYEILNIDHMNFKRKSLKFKCRKAGR